MTTDLITIAEAADILREPAHRIRNEIDSTGAYQGKYVVERGSRIYLSRSHVESLLRTAYFQGR